MATKLFYLRSIFEAEPTGGLRGVISRQGHNIINKEYKIGCSPSLSPALAEEKDQVVSALLGAIGLNYAPDTNPSQAAETAWRIASNPHGRFQDQVPYTEGFISDTNEPPLPRIDVSEHITMAFRSRQDYFGQYDGGAGNNFVLVDFITGNHHRVI